MPMFLVDLAQGQCVREAPSLRQVRAKMRKLHGTLNFKSAREAKMDDLLRVKQQGGWLPEHIRPSVEQHEAERKLAAR